MLQNIICIFIIAMLSANFSHNQCLVEEQANTKSLVELDGVYEFVSEATVLSEPRKETGFRASSEWDGIWQFQNGYYTCVLMKKRRPNFYSRENLDDLGFESFAGHYDIKGNSVRLEQTYAFNPMDVGRSVLLVYQLDGDTLVLTEKLNPSVEDIRRGTVTITLRRIK